VTASLPSLVDIGLNLTHDSFAHDRAAVMERALAAGVTRMLVTGSSVEQSRAALELARTHPASLRATVGIHPHHASEWRPDTTGQLRALLDSPLALAVGECGLDFFRNFSPHADQEHAFREQLALAGVTGKPVFLHQRDAHEPFIALLREYRSQLTGGVAHCFTAGLDEARAYLDLDLYLGVTGWVCDERRGDDLRTVVPFIPRERLLVETDAPYLLPRDLEPRPKDRRNEPAWLPHIVAAVADLRGETVEDVATYTTENALRLFGWRD